MSSHGLVSGNIRHSLAERGADLYETPHVAVKALLAYESIPFTVWEPCCGPGSIVKTLRDTGRGVIAHDLFDYGCPHSHSGVDFLQTETAPPGVPCIVTNPPYKHATQFIEKAVALSPMVCMLLRLEYLAAHHGGLLDRHPPSRIYAFNRRLPMMHRHGWEGPRATSRFNFAWYVWDQTPGETTLYRIGWKDEDSPMEQASSASEGQEEAPVGQAVSG